MHLKQSGLFCLDTLPESAFLQGIYPFKGFRDINLHFIPCNTNILSYGIVPTSECIADLDNQIKYLKVPYLSWVVNVERFD